jgi:hypothetical protein
MEGEVLPAIFKGRHQPILVKKRTGRLLSEWKNTFAAFRQAK